jgi:hypothetical protein
MSEIPFNCGEARQKWFDMARRMYVQHGSPGPDDLKVGQHIAGCPTAQRQELNRAYFDILRPNRLSAEEVSVALQGLARRIGSASN